MQANEATAVGKGRNRATRRKLRLASGNPPPQARDPGVKTAGQDICETRKVRALIADDSPLMLRILAQILEAEGYFTLVGCVTDGSQAVRQTLNLKPELVLMDYSMPRMNGIDATRCIKQVQDPPFVIIITSNDTPACKTLAEAAGADGFVLKGEDLHHQLRLALRGLFQFSTKTLPRQASLEGGGSTSNPDEPGDPDQ